MPKRKPAGVSGDFLAGVQFVSLEDPATLHNTIALAVGESPAPHPLDIPEFLKVKNRSATCAPIELKQVEETIDPIEAELQVDVRKMIAPAGVLTDDTTRALYLAMKYASATGRATAREERSAAKEAQRATQRAEFDTSHEQRRNERVAKDAKRAAQRVAKDGKISVGQIAAELGVTGLQARTALRAMMKKPAGGWSFDPKEASAIKEKVKSWLANKQTTRGATRGTPPSSAASDAPSGKRSKSSKKATTPKATRPRSTKRRSSSKKR